MFIMKSSTSCQNYTAIFWGSWYYFEKFKLLSSFFPWYPIIYMFWLFIFPIKQSIWWATATFCNASCKLGRLWDLDKCEVTQECKEWEWHCSLVVQRTSACCRWGSSCGCTCWGSKYANGIRLSSCERDVGTWSPKGEIAIWASSWAITTCSTARYSGMMGKASLYNLSNLFSIWMNLFMC